MPALKKRLSAAEKEEEDDQLRRNPEADGFELEAEKEDLNEIDEKEDDDNEESEDVEDDDVKRHDEEEDEVEEAEEEEALEEEDSKEKIQSSSAEEESDSEFLDVDLEDIRKDVECPICLGIIKKTRTVMECLHRFCRECIDKAMRLGNNECPACRKHVASRRSLRDDPNFDAFIAALFKNIDSYEQEEITFHEDDEARKKQIQESIAQVSQRQSEALGKRKSIVKETTPVVSTRPQRIRGRGNITPEAHDDDDDDDEEDNNNDNKDKDSSSSDEASVEIQRRKPKKRSATTRPSSSSGEASVEIQLRKRKRRSTATRPSSSDEASVEIKQRKRKKRSKTTRPSSSNADNDAEETRPRLVWNAELLMWGKGGTRTSNIRHGINNNNSGVNSRNVKNAHRMNRLEQYIGSLESKKNTLELDIHLKLSSMDTKSLPNLTQSYLCCKSSLLMKQLREYVALQMQLNAEEIELLLSNGEDKIIIEKMQNLKDDETLANLKSGFISNHDEYLIVVYRKKQTGISS